MATWDTGTDICSCAHCGAKHVYTYLEFPTADNIGEQECLACGKELISWNGSRDYFDFRLAAPNLWKGK